MGNNNYCANKNLGSIKFCSARGLFTNQTAEAELQILVRGGSKQKISYICMRDNASKG